MSAGLDTITTHWPAYGRALTTQTPFRSVVALPLLSPRPRLRCGALDLYLTTPDPSSHFPAAFLSRVAAEIADPIAGVLFDGQPLGPSLGRPGAGYLPPWLDHVAVIDRLHVWVAVGILHEHAGLTQTDALLALRAYAASHHTTLDDLAEELMTDQVAPQAVLA